jgi:hypothetical protein
MNATRTILGIATAAALAAGSSLGVASPATASTKASGSMTYTMTKVAADELRPAGVTIAFGEGGKGLAVTGLDVVSNEFYGDIIRVKLSGQVVFSKGGASYSASGFQAEWFDEEQIDEDYGVLTDAKDRSPFTLRPFDRKVNVKVNKAKKTRTTTRTVKAYLNLSPDPTRTNAARLNRALKTQVFFPGMLLGTVTFVVASTARCKNSACTR